MTRAEIAEVLHTHRWKSWRDGELFVCKAGCLVLTRRPGSQLTSRVEAEHQADVLAGLFDKEKDRLL